MLLTKVSNIPTFVIFWISNLNSYSLKIIKIIMLCLLSMNFFYSYLLSLSEPDFLSGHGHTEGHAEGLKARIKRSIESENCR